MTLGEGILFLLGIVLAIVIIGVSLLLMNKAKVDNSSWIATRFALTLVIWLSTVSALSLAGWTSEWESFPPRVPLLLVIATVTYVLVSSSQVAKVALMVTPMWLPVLVQTMRIVVEIALWQMHREGNVPVQFTIEGRNFDLFIGLTAPLVALGIGRKWIGSKTLVVWNFVGLAFLANAILTAATSSPGPQHLNWPGEPFTSIATWPLIWLPTFLAPTAIFLHVVSLRQCFVSRHIAKGSEGRASS